MTEQTTTKSSTMLFNDVPFAAKSASTQNEIYVAMNLDCVTYLVEIFNHINKVRVFRESFCATYII